MSKYEQLVLTALFALSACHQPIDSNNHQQEIINNLDPIGIPNHPALPIEDRINSNSIYLPDVVRNTVTETATTTPASEKKSEPLSPLQIDQMQVFEIPFKEPNITFETWLQNLSENNIPYYDFPTATEPRTHLIYGLGYATYYGELYEVAVQTIDYRATVIRHDIATGIKSELELTNSEKNILRIAGGLDGMTLPDGIEPIEGFPVETNFLVDNQFGLDPQEALKSNRYVGFVATRSVNDIGNKYLAYSVEYPGSPPTFIGIALSIDTAAYGDWYGLDSTRDHGLVYSRYKLNNWADTPLPWLADATFNLWPHLPVGLTGNPNFTAEGRPGLLLVSEEKYLEIINGDIGKQLYQGQISPQ